MGASSTGLDSHSYMQSVAALDAADDGMRKALRLLAAQQQRQYDPPSASRLSSRSTLSDTTLSGYWDSSPAFSSQDLSEKFATSRKHSGLNTETQAAAAGSLRACVPAAAAARHAADLAHTARAEWPDARLEGEAAHLATEPTSAWRSMVATAASAAGSGAKSAPLSRVHRDVPPLTSLSQGANPGAAIVSARSSGSKMAAIAERSSESREPLASPRNCVSVREFEELYAVHTSLRHELAMHGLDVRGGLVGGWSVRVSSLQALLTLISASCEEGSSDAIRVDAAITALSMPHSQLSQAGSSHKGSASARANAIGSAVDASSQGTRSGGNSAESAGALVHSPQLSAQMERTLEAYLARLDSTAHGTAAEAARRAQSGSPRGGDVTAGVSEPAHEAELRERLHAGRAAVAELDAHSRHTVALLRAWERATLQLSLRCTRAETEADRAHAALDRALRLTQIAPPVPAAAAERSFAAVVPDAQSEGLTAAVAAAAAISRNVSTALPVISPLASQQSASESSTPHPATSTSELTDVSDQAALRRASVAVAACASERCDAASSTDGAPSDTPRAAVDAEQPGAADAKVVNGTPGTADGHASGLNSAT